MGIAKEGTLYRKTSSKLALSRETIQALNSLAANYTGNDSAKPSIGGSCGCGTDACR